MAAKLGALESALQQRSGSQRWCAAIEELFYFISDELETEEAFDLLATVAAAETARTGGTAESHYYLGMAQRHLGQYAAAEKSLRAAITHEDEIWEEDIHRERAMTLAHLGREDEALAEAELNSFDPGYLRAYVWAALGKIDRSTRELETIQRIDAYEIVENRGETVFAEVFQSDAGKGVIAAAQASIAFGEKVQKLIEKENFAKALRISEKRARKVPDDDDGWYWKGTALSRMKKDVEHFGEED